MPSPSRASTRTATDVPTYLLDVNVLIALAWPSHIHHRRAHTWWASITRWATTPITESAFVRLSTNRTVVGTSISVSEARSTLRAIREAPGHTFIADDTSLATPSIDLSRVATSSQVTDAHLVNIAASNKAVLATMDAGILKLLSPDAQAAVLLLPGSEKPHRA